MKLTCSIAQQRVSNVQKQSGQSCDMCQPQLADRCASRTGIETWYNAFIEDSIVSRCLRQEWRNTDEKHRSSLKA